MNRVEAAIVGTLLSIPFTVALGLAMSGRCLRALDALTAWIRRGGAS